MGARTSPPERLIRLQSLTRRDGCHRKILKGWSTRLSNLGGVRRGEREVEGRVTGPRMKILALKSRPGTTLSINAMPPSSLLSKRGYRTR